MSEMTERDSLPAAAPIGIIIGSEEPFCYWMRGNGDWYFLNQKHHACSCPYYYHRGHLDNPCKHLKALFVWLQTRKEGEDAETHHLNADGDLHWAVHHHGGTVWPDDDRAW